jgi:hypothetical protein
VTVSCVVERKPIVFLHTNPTPSFVTARDVDAARLLLQRIEC